MAASWREEQLFTSKLSRKAATPTAQTLATDLSVRLSAMTTAQMQTAAVATERGMQVEQAEAERQAMLLQLEVLRASRDVLSRTCAALKSRLWAEEKRAAGFFKRQLDLVAPRRLRRRLRGIVQSPLLPLRRRRSGPAARARAERAEAKDASALSHLRRTGRLTGKSVWRPSVTYICLPHGTHACHGRVAWATGVARPPTALIVAYLVPWLPAAEV